MNRMMEGYLTELDSCGRLEGRLQVTRFALVTSIVIGPPLMRTTPAPGDGARPPDFFQVTDHAAVRGPSRRLFVTRRHATLAMHV